MANEKIAFIDHEYHIKTKSGEFLRQILKKNFEIHDFWVGKKNKFKIPIETLKFDNFFFFQILPDLKFLKNAKGKNIIWAPMYDSPHYPIGYSELLWDIIEYYNVKIISFSRLISKALNKRKIKFINLKFYKPTNYSARESKLKKINIFFWYRNDLKLDFFLNFLNLKDINKITYLTLDNLEPEKIITKNLKINFLKKKFLTNKLFKSYLKKHDIFLCPRKKEGIGMAQIEALSVGNYLVGVNDSTMNEYILSNKIGFVIDQSKKKKISLKFVKKYFELRKKINNKNYLKYQNDLKYIPNFIKSKNKKFKKNLLLEFKLNLFFLIKLLTRKINNMLINN